MNVSCVRSKRMIFLSEGSKHECVVYKKYMYECFVCKK